MKRILMLLLIAVSANVYAQANVRAVFTNENIDIDGYLDEAVWTSAEPITEFYQREPDVGEPCSEKTEVYVLYDKDNLYIGCKLYDDPKLITAKEVARDASLGSEDAIKIIIDTFLDKRNAFWFQINARGCMGDALISQNGAVFNKSWDGIWIGRSKVVEDGWTTEIAIPFKTFSFNKNQTTWGFKLNRNIARKQENAFWPVANVDSYKFQVSDAGPLEGLKDLSQGIGLDISPYALFGMDNEPSEDREYPVDAGVDMFYQITPSVKSALTVNTDFAQTEVDDRMINLTRFPLLFPEKRDFFLDGAGYFNFGLELDNRDNPYANKLIPFFSRRIGLDGNGNPVPIKWGGKVTGQIGQWNMGLLAIADERDDKNQEYAVARISRNIGGQSSIGFIGTTGNSVGDADNHVIGADVKLATSNFRGNQNLGVILFGLKSSTDGLSGNDMSWGGDIIYPNDFLYIRTGFHEIGDNFLPGIGFQKRSGIRETYGNIAVGPRPNRWGIMQYYIKTGYDYITNMDNELETRELELTPLSVRFKTGDQFEVAMLPTYERLSSDFAIHTDHTIPTDIYEFNRFQTSVTSAQHRKAWVGLSYEWGDFYTGNRQETVLESGFKIGVPFYLGVAYEHNSVSLATGDFDTDVMRVNFNFLFSPNVTLYNFVQYDNLSKKMGIQSRFVWIMKPGNEILLVWRTIAQDPFDHWETQEDNARMKLRYNYRF